MAMRVILAVLMLLVPIGAAGQSDDRQLIVRFLEDNLSDAGREVRITGFQGALSGRAQIEELTISDVDGVWLRLRGAVLDWNRRALFRGRLEVRELSAASLEIPRFPVTDAAESDSASAFTLPELPTPEAQVFRLPELPVSIDVAKLRIDRLKLGVAPLETPALLRVDGRADLASGSGSAEFSIERIDGKVGQLATYFSLEKEGGRLEFSVDAREGPDGLVTGFLGVPGAPAMDVSLTGSGTGGEIVATLVAATDGETRLRGDLAWSDARDAAGTLTQTITADLAGDLRPVVAEPYREFLGADSSISLLGTRSQATGTDLQKLLVSTRSMRLEGSASLSPEFWPRRFDVDGWIEPGDQDDILLPIPGQPVHIGASSLNVSYDQTRGDAWTLKLTTDGLRTPDVTLSDLALDGQGQIVGAEGDAVAHANGALEWRVREINGASSILAALGPDLSGAVQFRRESGQPLYLDELGVEAEALRLQGSAALGDLVGDGSFVVGADLVVDARNVGLFSDIAGRPLGGAAQGTAEGQLTPVSGAFAVDLAVITTDLQVGDKRADAMLAGQTDLSLRAERDLNGMRIEALSATNAQLDLTARADLKSAGSSAQVDARISNLAAIDAKASGPAALSLTMAAQEGGVAVDLSASAPGDVDIRFSGTGTFNEDVLTRVAGQLSASATDLTPYQGLADRAVGGGVSINAEGWSATDGNAFALTVDGTAQDLKIGQPEADTLMRGAVVLDADLSRENADSIEITSFSVAGPELQGTANGRVGPASSDLAFDAALTDIGRFVDGISGRLAVAGTASRRTEDWTIGLRASGPGGADATIDGDIAPDASNADLRINGTLPIALANRFIKPNLAEGQVRMNLRLDGPPGIAALSGTLATEGAGFTTSDQSIVLSAISANADLSGGKATVNSRMTANRTGTIEVSGTVALENERRADLGVSLRGIPLSDGAFYETSVDGRVSINGPATAPTIAGRITLGQTEVNLGAALSSTPAAVTGVVHHHDTRAARSTRMNAGFETSASEDRGQAPPIPLDLTISAPARIFLRGRGLDAEMGGSLRIEGTAQEVVPRGRFDLIRGRMDFLGRRLELTEGLAQIRGDLEAYFFVAADARADDTDVRVEVEGIGTEISIRLTSSPELPEDEILSRLLFGRSVAELSPTQALRMAAAARTLGSGNDGLLNRIRAKVGLDDLDITSDETGATEVRAGKYISDNVYTDVGVDSEGGSNVQINLFINRSLTARGSTDSEGQSSIGLFYERDY